MWPRWRSGGDEAAGWLGGLRREARKAPAPSRVPEVTRLMEFFSEQHGRFGSFDFEDPWTGSVVTNCRFEQDHAAATADGEWNNGTRLTIVEPASS